MKTFALIALSVIAITGTNAQFFLNEDPISVVCSPSEDGFVVFVPLHEILPEHFSQWCNLGQHLLHALPAFWKITQVVLWLPFPMAHLLYSAENGDGLPVEQASYHT